MKIKLNFEHHQFISPGQIQDRLVIFFNQTQYFFSKEKMVEISEGTRTIKGRIRKQVLDNWFTNFVLDSAGAINDTLMFCLVISFFLASQIPGAMRVLISFLNSFQIIIHLPVLRIVIPGNVAIYKSILLDVTQYDILDPEWTTEKVFNFDHNQQEILNLQEFSQIIDMGYETHNIILCLGSVFFFIISYFLLLIVLVVLKYTQEKHIYLKRAYKYLKKYLIFHLMIALIFDSYIFSLFSSVQNFQHPIDTVNGEVLAKYFTYFMLFVLLVLTPSIILYVITRPLETIQDPEFENVWGTTYLEVKTRSKWQLMYYPLFILRCILFILAFFALKNYPAFQIMSVLLYNMLITEYNGQFFPLQDRLKNLIEIHNEVFVSWLSFFFLLFTEWGPEEHIKFEYGWVYIYILLLYCSTNTIITLFNVIYNLYLVWKKYSSLLKWYHPWLFCKKKKQPSMRVFKPDENKSKAPSLQVVAVKQQRILSTNKSKIAAQLENLGALEEEKKEIDNSEVDQPQIKVKSFSELMDEIDQKYAKQKEESDRRAIQETQNKFTDQDIDYAAKLKRFKPFTFDPPQSLPNSGPGDKFKLFASIQGFRKPFQFQQPSPIIQPQFQPFRKEIAEESNEQQTLRLNRYASSLNKYNFHLRNQEHYDNYKETIEEKLRKIGYKGKFK